MEKKFFCGILCIAIFVSSFTAGYADASTQSKSPFTGSTYTHADIFDDSDIAHGIDVSYHNGSIDWNKAKDSGVEFAILRVGYRGYGTAGRVCADSKYDTYIKEALAAGIAVGVYFFTDAINTTEAVEEANYCLEQVKGYNVTLPIVLDYEYPTSNGSPVGRMYNAKLSKSAATKNCQAFCDTIAAAGYTPMIYANKSDFTNLIDGAALSKTYKIWLANYTTKTTYANSYEFWQYSSTGSVNGISGNVDCNFWYKKSGDNSDNNNSNNNNNNNNDNNNNNNGTKPVKISTASIADIAVQSFNGSPRQPKPSVTLNGKTLVSGTDYTLSYKNNIYPGTAQLTIAGKGNYTGSMTKKFTVKLTAPSPFSAVSGKKTLKLTWKAKTGVTGYQLERKPAYNGSYSRIQTIKKASTSSFKDTALKTDREYYYRIRAYVKNGSKTHYSAYKTLTAATLSHKQAGITSKAVTLRKTPSAKGKKLITIPKGAPIQYLGHTYLKNKKSFYHIRYTSGNKVYTGYAASVKGIKYYTGGQTATNLNFRKTAGTDGKLLGVIPSGTVIPLLKSKKVSGTVWHQTKYNNGSKTYTGWVSSAYIL